MAVARDLQFLEVARQLILEEGMVSFKFTDIAKRAEVSRVTLYKHFPSKEDVLVGLFVVDANKSREMLIDILNDSQLNDQEKLLTSLLAPVSVSMENRNLLGITFLSANPGIYMFASQKRQDDLQDISDQLRDINIQFLADPIKRGTLHAEPSSLRDITGKFYPYQRGSVLISQNVLSSTKQINFTLETVFNNLLEDSSKLPWAEGHKTVNFVNVIKALGRYERDSMIAC